MATEPLALTRCRAIGSTNSIPVVSLGNQALSGVFPHSKTQQITSGPLQLVLCPDSGLLQLAHSYDTSEMYGENYGYRSGLNQSMTRHLTQIVRHIEHHYQPKPQDIVVDIGSNDATLLKAYATPDLRRVGIDPTGDKFRQYYPDDVTLVPDFFSAAAYRRAQTSRAKVVTSVAMFYDLEDPTAFARNIEEILADDGIWYFEQSYMPSMLRLNSYDTICHEHLEYYSLGVVLDILQRANLKALDVRMSAANGGSFGVTAAKQNSPLRANEPLIQWLLQQEDALELKTVKPYRAFEQRAHKHRDDLRRLLQALAADGKKVMGYGASTKGNTVLQFCNITDKELVAIAEVNEEKFGAFTPGSNIPIISEAEARKIKPDYFLVLPWHFRDGILQREAEFLAAGGRMIFPFPEIEII